MPRIIAKFRAHKARFAVSSAFLSLLVLAFLLLVPGVGSAYSTNFVQLDNGTCGHNLQLGSVLTASSTATPTFYLTGDGGASTYQAFIDGTSIGTFNGDVFTVVCITDSLHLADGAHTLTVKELAPNPGNAVAPFAFTVDTTPPSMTSAPVLPPYSDTGVVGDNVTSYTADTLIGTSDPSVPIRVYSGSRLVGGAMADSSGNWSVRTITLNPGSYSLTAVAVDEAGNQSSASPALNMTIDTAPPTTSISSPAAGATVSGTVNLAASASDNTAVWKVAFQLDGTTLATDTASPYTYSWNSGAVATGNHTLTVVATDTAGNTTSTSETITVQSGGGGGTITAPSAPTLTSATAGNSTVALAWTAPSSNGGSTITGYRIYRSTTAGNETLLTTLGNITSWTDTSLTNGTTYYYKVSALNSAGEGSASNELSATPASVPGAPTLMSAVPGNSVTLTWTAPTNTGGSTITGYRIYRSTSSGNETLLTSVGNVTTYTDETTTYGTTYYFEVSAMTSTGEGARSNEMSATPIIAPSAPSLNGAAAGNGLVALAWSAPSSNGGSAVTGYRIYRSTTSGNETLLTTLGNVTSWTDGSAGNGTTYYYKVSALNSAGESVASNEMSATPTAPITAPSAPAFNNATAGNGSVALAWRAPSSNGGSSITGYRIYRSTTSGNETLLTTLGNVTSWTDNGTTNGTTYYYKVSALNSAGESVASNELSATPTAPITAPGAPMLSSASGSNGSVALAWSAPSSNGGSAITGYRVYRSTSSGGETLFATLGNVTAWTDSNVGNGTTYYYEVSAINSVGEGVASNERSATPTAPATAPGAPTLSSASAAKRGGFALSWKAPTSNGGSAITGYRVYRSTSSGNETLIATVGNVTSWTDSGASSGTTYYYKVSAVNAVGEGPGSNELSTASTRKGHH